MISMFVRQYNPSVYFNSVMSNKRKCSFLIILLTTLFCQYGNAQRINFQSRPSEFQANDDSSVYRPFASEYSTDFGNFNKNQPPSKSSNTGLFFPSGNAQNGFQRDIDFESVRRDEKHQKAWNHKENTYNQRGDGHNWSQNEDKKHGFGSFVAQQPEKNSGLGDNSRRGSGFQNTQSGNQMNSNSFLDFGSNRKKNNGFNTNSGWNSGKKNEDSGNREYQVSAAKETPEDNWNTNSNNWNSGFDSGKKQGGSQTAANPWKSEGSKHFQNVFNPFQTNQAKPGGSNTVTNQWNTSVKPDKVSFTKPPKGHGNDKIPPQKPSGSSSNSKPGTNAGQIDWDNLERKNNKGELTVDLSQLWYSTDRKNPSGNEMKSKKRNVPADHQNNCYCTEYDECDPDKRVKVSHVFGSDNAHLRSMFLDCASEKKICCFPPLRKVSNKLYDQPDQYEIQGTNLRPTCGKRITKHTQNDETEDGLANYGDFPWILRLIAVDEDGEGEKTLCSASLIHSSIALTTASCALLLSGENIRVRAGEWNTATGHERNKIQEAKIGKIFLHPDFDFVSYANNYALIFLDLAFDYNLGTNSVCLPSPDDAWDSSRCMVSGWFIEDIQGTGKPLLTKTNLTNVSRGKCRNTPEYTVNDDEDKRYMCGYAVSGDPCIANAGALMCPLYNSDMLVQVGFLSPAGICNEFYKTGTFIDIMESIDWITHMEGIYLYFRNEKLQQ